MPVASEEGNKVKKPVYDLPEEAYYGANVKPPQEFKTDWDHRNERIAATQALLKPTHNLRFLDGVLQQLWIPEPTGGQMPKQVWKDVPKVSSDPKESILISSEVKNRLVTHASKINGA